MASNLKQCLKVIVTTVGMGHTIQASLPPTVQLEKKAPFTKKDCKMLISQKEQQHKIPVGLLAAIASVESEFSAYAVNSNGKSKRFTNIGEAKNYVAGLRKQGVIDINIGALQINYAYHKNKFSNAMALLDPYQNIAYAAKYLAYLKRVYGSWIKAVKFYHSPDAKYQDIYITKVMNALKRTNYNSYCEVNGLNKVSLKPARVSTK